MLIGMLIKKFAYKVEDRQGGGFIAHPAAPDLGTLEADTREELDQKIDDRLSELLGTPLAKFRLSDIQHIPNAEFKVRFQTAVGQAMSGQLVERGAAGSTEPQPAEQSQYPHRGLFSQAANDIDETTPTREFAPPRKSQPTPNANQFGFNQPEPPPIAPEETKTGILKILIAIVLLLAVAYYFLHR